MGTTGRAVLGLEDATYTDADLDRTVCGPCSRGSHHRHRAMLAGACRVCDCTDGTDR